MAKKKLRVVLCSYPGLFSALVQNIIHPSPGIELVGLVHSTRIFSASEKRLRSVVRLLNSSGFAYAVCQFLQTDGFNAAALIFAKKKATAIPVLKTKNINDKNGREFLEALEPDVLLLANFNQKVSPFVINLPKFACLNIHPSLLPHYKGVDPVFAALNAGEHPLGVTLHHVAAAFDSGDVLAQDSLDVVAGRSVFFHQFRLFELGARLAAETIRQMPKIMPSQPQAGGGGYDSWPSRRQVREFLAKGGRLMALNDYCSALKSVFAGKA